MCEVITCRKQYVNRKSKKAKTGELKDLGRIYTPVTRRAIADFSLQLERWLPNNLDVFWGILMWVYLPPPQ